MMNTEIFYPLLGFEHDYEVSNLGRIFSIDRKRVYKDGRIFSYKRREIKGVKDKNGYICFLTSINRKLKSIKFHRAVISSIKGFIDGKNEVNHINGIKSDNRIDNLEWVTSKENKDHAYRSGFERKKPCIDNFKRGTSHHQTKILIVLNDNMEEIKRYCPINEAVKDGVRLGTLFKQMKKNKKYKGNYYKKICL